MSDLKPTARQSAPPGALLGALAGIEGEWARTEAFERIAPQLAPSDLAAALAFARGRPELWMRTRALVALLHTQPQRYRWAFVRELLDMIDAQPNMAMRATAFDRVLPIVREGEISAVTQVARRVGPRALLSTAEAFAERCGAAVVSALALEAWEGLVRELPTALDDEVVSRVRGLPFAQAVALLLPDDALRFRRLAHCAPSR